MKKFISIGIMTLCVLTVSILWAISRNEDPKIFAAQNNRPPRIIKYAQNTLPTDPQQTCTLSTREFNSWFVNGSSSPNGVVKPANSVTFSNSSNCDFYKWSEQMFLWLTSKSSTYNGTITLLSPTFYTVLPDYSLEPGATFFAPARTPDGSLRRQLVRNDPKQPLRAVAFLGKNHKVQTTEGQAGDTTTLMAQNGSLVYYITFVNDMYALYKTGVSAGKLNGLQFPTTQSVRDSIVKFAEKNGYPAPSDADALVMEIKSSWVELDSIPTSERGNFITAKAIIPTYKKTPQTWTPNGHRETTLALVGIHVVGSANGHPEMIWATLEHHSNTPNASYSYINNKGKTTLVPQDTGNNWIFSNNAADPFPNIGRMTWAITNGTVTATSANISISARKTLRYYVWGSNPYVQPNPIDASSAASNTELISLNNSIRSLWKAADIRKNYLLMGATWTAGVGPSGTSFPPLSSGVSLGTSQLANSTMETGFQGHLTGTTNQLGAFGGSCFGCHSNNNSLKPGDISHIFTSIKPLPSH